MSKLPEATATIIREQVGRIHRAVNDGTLDKDTINDALAQLTVLVDGTNGKDDSFDKFTGQDAKGTKDKAVDKKSAHA